MKGILFKPDMHQAIRERRKTVTRRLDHLKEINQEPDKWEKWDFHPEINWFSFNDRQGHSIVIRPLYHVGEVVYIKEAWAANPTYDDYKPSEIPATAFVTYLKDRYNALLIGKKRSPLFMPAWAARDFIKITGVRPERLQEIGGEGGFGDLPELRKEGLLYGESWVQGNVDLPMRYNSIHAYADLWDSINHKTPFSSNPFVWRYEFVQLEQEGR